MYTLQRLLLVAHMKASRWNHMVDVHNDDAQHMEIRSLIVAHEVNTETG